MLYLSEPLRAGEPKGPEQSRFERGLCIDAVCSTLIREKPGKVVLAQSLPDPQEGWAVDALTSASFQSVGTLLYMRRAPRAADRKHNVQIHPPTLPVGHMLVPLYAVPEEQRTALLVAAMDASYEETLDCPALCGLRETADILKSHRATGAFDPDLWWVVMRGDQPLGCLFLSMCPEQRTTELVYLGLAKQLRGKGLSRPLMQYGMAQITARQPDWPIACAVDERNAPAVHLYDSLGFRAFGRRIGFVKALRA